jgi:hypothetical protein
MADQRPVNDAQAERTCGLLKPPLRQIGQGGGICRQILLVGRCRLLEEFPLRGGQRLYDRSPPSA